jgi:hypothetical protein
MSWEGKRPPGLYWIKKNFWDEEWTIGELEEQLNPYGGESWLALGTDVNWNLPDVIGDPLTPPEK